MPDLLSIARQFQFPGDVDTVTPFGSGIINDTFVVTFKNIPGSAVGDSGGSRLGQRAVLQRINPAVFPAPAKVMQNLEQILGYAQRQSAADRDKDDDPFFLPPLYRTGEGSGYFRDSNQDIWRALGFVENTCTSDELQSMQQAHEAGRALGAFHRLLGDLPLDQLVDTLPGFHITPEYLKQYEEVRARVSPPSTDRRVWQFCHDVVGANRGLAGVLVNAQPSIKLRVMHGDPKLNNILFDQDTGKAVSIIDLDTVKPGLVQFDIADCLRSCCNRSGELPDPGEEVVFDMEACGRILEGYFSQAADMLDQRDVDYLPDAIQLLPFELGLRFFTDYLQGNQYFKVSSPSDNLYRAKTQFLLLQSIQRQQSSLAGLLSEFGPG